MFICRICKHLFSNHLLRVAGVSYALRAFEVCHAPEPAGHEDHEEDKGEEHGVSHDLPQWGEQGEKNPHHGFLIPSSATISSKMIKHITQKPISNKTQIILHLSSQVL